MNDRLRILLTVFGGGALAAGAYLLYRALTDKLTASRKANRRIIGCKPTGCLMLNGIALAGETETIRFEVPAVDTAFYQPHETSLIRNKLSLIDSQYGAYIRQAATLTRVPEAIIQAFIFIESGGNPTAISSNAYGLMQLDPAGITDILHLENKKKRLSGDEIAVLRKRLGIRIDNITAMRFMGDGGPFVTPADLYDPEFSILAGSIFIGILIDEHTEGETLRLDKVVARYNRGYFARQGLTGSPQEVLAAMPPVTQAYILKMMGINGVMEILIA